MKGIDIKTTGQFLAEYGKFSYKEVGGGRILVDTKWIASNMVTRNFPVIGAHTVHARCVDDITRIMIIIESITRASLLPIVHWDGCWVPRHKGWSSKRGLSLHSWGCAIDLNARTNCMGTPGNQDMRIVEAFEEVGWFWGGRWSKRNCDPMHFQRAGGHVIF